MSDEIYYISSRFHKSVKPCELRSLSVSVLSWICELGLEAGKDIRYKYFISHFTQDLKVTFLLKRKRNLYMIYNLEVIFRFALWREKLEKASNCFPTPGKMN